MSDEQNAVVTDTVETAAKRFYGTKAIKQHAETSDGKTVGLLFEDDTETNIPKWEFDYMVRDVPMDYVTMRNERANYVAQKILALLLELDFPVNELEFLNDKVFASIFDGSMPGSFHRAMDKLVDAATGGAVKKRSDLRFGDIETILVTPMVEEPKA